MRTVFRLAFGTLGLIGALGVVTGDWVSVLFSLGVLESAITFALQ